MDRAFACETQPRAGLGLGDHAVKVIEVQPGHVDHVDPCARRRVYDTRSRIEQRLPRICTPQVGGHIDSAEQKCIDTCARLRDFPGGLQPAVGLDDDLQPGGVACGAQSFGDTVYLLGCIYLGQHQRGRRRLGVEDCGHIRRSLGRAPHVDAHYPLDAVLRLGLRKDSQHVRARLVLVLRRDAVLQFQADNVRARGDGLGEHCQVRPGRENETAAGLDRLFAHVLAPLPEGRVSGGIE